MESKEGAGQEKKFQEIIHRNKPPYYHFLGIQILDVKLGYAKLKMDYDEKLTNPYGLINGGFYAVLADASLACALLGMTEADCRLLTIEYKMNLIAPVKGGWITSVANVIHCGREVAVGDVEIRNEVNALVAKALITYSIKRSSSGH